MHLFHFYHGHQIIKAVSTDFWLYELSIWMHALARAFVAVFIPILMLTAGYSIDAVIVYYLVYNLLDVPLNFLARYLTRKFGARWVIVLATLATIAFLFLFLNLTPDNWTILLLMALFAAVYDSFYWVAHLFFFIKSGGKTKDAGKTTGIMHAVRKSAGLLGPAFGALMLIFFDQSTLFIITIIFFILSLLPLLKVDDFPDKPEHKPLPLKKFFADKKGRLTFYSTALYSIHDSVENTLFPLFIFVVFGTIESVALVPVVVSITAIVVAIMLGNATTDYRARVMTIGALVIGSIWILRLFIEQGFFFYLSISIVGLFTYFILVPLDSGIFDHAKRVQDPLSASMYRNITYMGMNVLLYGSLAVLISVFDVSFVFAALGLFGMAIVNMIAIKSVHKSIKY